MGVQMQMLLQHPERQFDIPAACIQTDHIRRREQEGIKDVSEVAMPLTMAAKTHQAYRVASMIGAIAPYPHQSIEEIITLHKRMHDGIAGGLAGSGYPTQADGSQFVKKRKTGVPTIKEYQGTSWQAREQGSDMDFAIGLTIGKHIHAMPLLGSDVEEGGDPARGKQRTRSTMTQFFFVWETAKHCVQNTFIHG